MGWSDWSWLRGRKDVTSRSNHLRFWQKLFLAFFPYFGDLKAIYYDCSITHGGSLCHWIFGSKTTNPQWNSGECEISLSLIKLQRFGDLCFPIVYMGILLQKQTLLHRYYQKDQGNIKVFIDPCLLDSFVYDNDILNQGGTVDYWCMSKLTN